MSVVIEFFWRLCIVSCDKNFSTSLECVNESSLYSTFRSRCFVRIYTQSRCFEWILDSKAEFSYYTQWKHKENAIRSGVILLALGSGNMSLLPSLFSGCTGSVHMILPCFCTRYYPVPAHDITLSLHMILPSSCTWYYPVSAYDITISLHMILPCPCTWYYHLPAHDITLSLHMILPCPCTRYYPVPAHIPLSLHVILLCPCAWYYPVLAHYITLSLHMILPCPCIWY